MFKYVKFEKVEAEFTVLGFRGNNEDVKVNHFDVNVVSLEGDDSDIDALINSQDSRISCVELTKEEFKEFIKDSAQITRIYQRCEEMFNAEIHPLLKQYPLTERETWQKQIEQAKAYKDSGLDTDAPFLKILAENEGDTVENFANAVIEKANAYEVFMANSLANKRAYEARFKAEIGL